jgi:hypothetical protein
MRSPAAIICLLSITLTTMTPLQAQTHYRSSQPVTYTAGDEYQLAEDQPVASYNGMPYYSSGCDCGGCGSCGSPYPPMGQTILSILSDVHYGIDNTIGLSNTLSAIRRVKPVRRVVSHVVPPRLSVRRQQYTVYTQPTNEPVEQPAPAAQPMRPTPVQPAQPVRPATPPTRPPVERLENENPFSDDQATFQTRSSHAPPVQPVDRQKKPIEKPREMRVQRITRLRQPLSIENAASIAAAQGPERADSARTERVAPNNIASRSGLEQTRKIPPASVVKRSSARSLLDTSNMFANQPSKSNEKGTLSAAALSALPIARQTQPAISGPLTQSAIATRIQQQREVRPSLSAPVVAKTAQAEPQVARAATRPAPARPSPVRMAARTVSAEPKTVGKSTRSTPAKPEIAPIVRRTTAASTQPVKSREPQRAQPAPLKKLMRTAEPRLAPIVTTSTPQPQPAEAPVAPEEWGSLGELPAAEESYGELPSPDGLESIPTPAGDESPPPMIVRPLAYNAPAKSASSNSPATIKVAKTETRRANPLRDR